MPKIPICKVCGNEYEKFNSTQKVCGPKCALECGRTASQKAAKKRLRKETKEGREKLKTRSDHAKDTQTDCNKYIRLRDKDDGCISCDKPAGWNGQWHASHYRSSGNCSPLRFHPMNIHKACSECNNFKSGNLSEYRISLIKKIGLENVEWLESQNRAYTWEIDDLKEIRKYYKEKIKLL